MGANSFRKTHQEIAAAKSRSPPIQGRLWRKQLLEGAKMIQ